ncbi:MAG: P63C domain-containing protein [Gammaproteobacteria bacterium]
MPKDKIIEPINAPFDAVSKAMVKTNDTGKLPIAMYHGELPIGDLVLDCAVLDNGTRVLSATSIFEAFGRSRKGQNKRLEIDGTKLPPFVAAKNLEPYIDQSVIERTKLIEYKDGNRTKTGYAASLLPKVCEVYLAARRTIKLTEGQERVAMQAEILLGALAQVGIDALVDEATGYQLDRKHDALRMLLSKYIAEGLQKWIHTFPDTFFAELDKLYGNQPTTARNRPQYYGKFINKYIYDPIEHGYVKKELDKLNIKDDGKRRAKFHQWLNDHGRNILIHQIGRVQMLMEMCQDIKQFKQAAEKQKKVSIAPYLFDEMNQIIE